MIKVDKNNIISTLLLFFIVGVVAFILYYSRQIFFYQYEPEYYENWFYHSQWNIAQSTRGIADGELYKFVGYRIVEGENPFNINYETPPLGKYFYGWFEKYTGNPYWVSIIIYFLSIYLIYKISNKLFKDRKQSLVLTLLFVSTPLIATQVKETMLDLPLMTFYLLHLYFFLDYLSNKKRLTLILAGVFLGLAAGIKIAVYTPLIIALGLLLIVLQRKFINFILYPLTVVAGFVLSYFSYFINHPNPIPWLRLLDDKTITFYLSSSISAEYLNQWKTIFLNSYQGWWQPGQKISVGDWSYILPAGVLATVITLILSIKNKRQEWFYIAALSAIFLAVNTIIPFWPRYLIPVVPLFIFVLGYLFRRYVLLLLILVFLNIPFLIGTMTAEDLRGNSEATARFISTRAYRELYRSINLDQRKVMNENDFIKYNEYFLEELGVRNISVSIDKITKTSNGMNVKHKITYLTKYGILETSPVFEYLKINNQPKLVWKWEYLWPGFKPESQIIKEETTIPFLKAINVNDVPVLERGNWKMVYIIPRLMYDWGKASNALSDLTDKSTREVDKQLQSVIPDQYPRFVGYLTQKYGEKGIEKALSIPGVRLIDIDYARISENVFDPLKPETFGYPLTVLKDQYQSRPELFYVQSNIYIKDSNGNRIQLPFEKYPEKDVIIRI